VPSNSPVNTTEVLPWRCRFVRHCKASLASGRTAISAVLPTLLTRAEYRMGQGNLVLVPPGRDVKEVPSVLSIRALFHSGRAFAQQRFWGRDCATSIRSLGAPRRSIGWQQGRLPRLALAQRDALRKVGAGRSVRRVSAVAIIASSGRRTRALTRRHGPCLCDMACTAGARLPTRETVPGASSGR
jgi:hypothetical protein